MDLIRPFQRDDIPAVQELFLRAFSRNGYHAPLAIPLASYFERVFFDNPWYDDELPSLLHVNDGGAIDGFIGVLPKRLRFRGRPIRAIAATKLMAAPTAAPLVASRLVRHVLAGPQDLLFSDISNDAGRRIFEALGGAATLQLYSLKWQRPVRPARHALGWLEAHGTPRLVARSLRPLAAMADTALARWGPATVRSRSASDGYTIDDLPLDVAATRLPDVLGGRALQPDYDTQWLEWLLGIAQQMDPRRVLRRRLVRDAQQQPIGWFLYFVEPGGMAEVLQLVAKKGADAPVFDALLADARSAGAAIVAGKLEPSMVREMSARHCYFRQSEHWSLAHTKDPEILRAILDGNAFLSRLEGEW